MDGTANGSGPVPLPEQRARGIVGYTAGVFDMFHMGHLHLLKQARARCDYLIVAVTTDELALEVKGTPPVVPLLERMAIVESMRYVDHVIPQLSWDKTAAWHTFRYDLLFVGDNLRGTPQWDLNERELEPLGVRVEYLASTYGRNCRLLERGLQDLVAE
jgi:glycerol-3-phosphate cytidylyltransferase